MDDAIKRRLEAISDKGMRDGSAATREMLETVGARYGEDSVTGLSTALRYEMAMHTASKMVELLVETCDVPEAVKPMLEAMAEAAERQEDDARKSMLTLIASKLTRINPTANPTAADEFIEQSLHILDRLHLTVRQIEGRGKAAMKSHHEGGGHDA